MNASVGAVDISAPQITIRGNSIITGGAASISNAGENAVLITAAAQSSDGMVSDTYEVDLGSGKTFQLPAPPSNQTWQITITTAGQIAKLAGDVAGGSIGILALAGYGVWKLGEAILSKSHRRY